MKKVIISNGKEEVILTGEPAQQVESLILVNVQSNIAELQEEYLKDPTNPKWQERRKLKTPFPGKA